MSSVDTKASRNEWMPIEAENSSAGKEPALDACRDRGHTVPEGRDGFSLVSTASKLPKQNCLNSHRDFFRRHNFWGAGGVFVDRARVLVVPPWVENPVLVKDGRRGRSADKLVDAKKAAMGVAQGRYERTTLKPMLVLTSRGLIAMEIFRKVCKPRPVKAEPEKSWPLRGLTCRMSPRKPGTGGRPGDSWFERLLGDLAGRNAVRQAEAQKTLRAFLEER